MSIELYKLFAFILFVSSLMRNCEARSECLQVVGTLVCPDRPVLAGRVRMDLRDADCKCLEAYF